MKWIYVYYFVLTIIRLVVAQFYNGLFNPKEDGVAVFILTVLTDILLYIMLCHTHASTDYKNRIDHIILYYSTSCVSLMAFACSLSHAWITFLLIAMKLFSLYRMYFVMMLVAALGMLISFHHHALLFIIMCWSLFVERWILFTENDQNEGRTNKFLNCILLIILSTYAYYNSKSLILTTWIFPPWTTYYHLLFLLYMFSTPSKYSDDHHWQPWDILTNHASPVPIFPIALKGVIKKVKYLYSSFQTQWLFAIIFYILYILPPIILTLLIDDNNSKVSDQFVSSTTGLLLMMAAGREIAIRAANKIWTNYRKIYLFLTWFLINIAVLIIYYKIYSCTSFTFHYYCYVLHSADLIDYGCFFGLTLIGSLWRWKANTTTIVV